MPNWVGMNSKSVEAKARKQAAGEEKERKKATEQEDAKWADGDKKVAAKLNRQAEQQQKSEQKATRKAELRQLQEQEESSTGKSSASTKKEAKPPKLTRHEIAQRAMRAALEKSKEAEEEKRMATQEYTPTGSITSNVNQELKEQQLALQAEGGELMAARGVDAAVAALAAPEGVDRHPERRMKAVRT
eukprot:GHVT01031707.1.p1 GENE.GHVT01031707.1~~GHVT01031707.1.p1  ORF type:complete len:188 (+),score=69.16 GHVT01031707.1:1393-1956(+)